MDILSYRHRTVTDTDLRFIRELIAAHPNDSRRALSKRLCEAWQWVQANGALRDMVCRGLMLALHRAGHIELPPVTKKPPNPLAVRRPPLRCEIDRTPITGALKHCRPLAIVPVRRTTQEALFNSLLAEHHYLGYTQPVGEHLKYLVLSEARPIACLAWSSAPRHLGARDRYIGWSKEARLRNIRLIAYNTRFLILPWVEVPHLASHLLGHIARRIASDWEALYHHRVVLLETFIDPARFRGTCYRAANWVSLGLTTGRGHNAITKRCTQPVKEIWAYPLQQDFRRWLSQP
jgi:hypothetical protein